MLSLPFYKLSPGGNTTVIVLDAPVPATEYARVAATLLDPMHLGAEQVGFLDTSGEVPELTMMGGEFCGNATRSAGVVLAREGRLQEEEGTGWAGCLRVSGADRELAVQVDRTPTGYAARTEMPVPGPLEQAPVRAIRPGMDLITLPGISHVLLDRESFPRPEEYAAAARDIREELSLTGQEAVGCIWHGREHGREVIEPVVWVRDLGVTHFETGCGSGTLALALRDAWASRASVERTVLQPSGQSIKAEVFCENGEVSRAAIGGSVDLIAVGQGYLRSPDCNP
jgi:diaminopimelate epimerase